MIITREILANMLAKYVNREIEITGLVDWAEDMISEADFEEPEGCY